VAQTERSGLLYVPVTITLEGSDEAPIVMVLDANTRCRVDLTPAQARAIAADLNQMAADTE
jgi:hypothetical protein